MRRRALALLLASILAVPAVAAPRFTPPNAERLVLSNGVVLYLLEDHELPLVDMRLRIPTSPALEPADRPDSLRMLGATWRSGGTRTRTVDALNEELEAAAISIESAVDPEAATLSMGCLSRQFEHGLDVMAEILLEPRFDAAQVRLTRDAVLEALRRKNDTPAQIARRLFRRSVFGPEHLYSRQPTEAATRRLSAGYLRSLHRRIAVPDGAVITLVGDVRRADAVAALERRLGGWKPTGRALPDYDYAVTAAPRGAVFVTRKQAAQSRITVGRTGPARHHADHHALEIADYILGGGGASRLFGQIRSRLGLAYVVGSFVGESRGVGMLGVGCQTKTRSTMAAARAIRAELARFAAGPIHADEIALARQALVQSFVFRFDGASRIAHEQADLEFYGYPAGYLTSYVDKLNAVTAADVARVAATWYAPEAMRFIIVGDVAGFDGEPSELGETVEVPLESIP